MLLHYIMGDTRVFEHRRNKMYIIYMQLYTFSVNLSNLFVHVQEFVCLSK